MISLTVNGQKHALDVEPETPLLWVLRDELGLTGTKFGCGIAQCGACSVHLNGALTRSCVVRVGDVDGASVLTIEGLSQDASHALSHDASHALSHDASHALSHDAPRAVARCIPRGATRLDRARRAAMRLLPVRSDHGGGGPAATDAAAERS